MANSPWHNEEAWDENRWEAFLRESDRRSDRYMELLFQFMQEHPHPGEENKKSLSDWETRFRNFLRRKGWLDAIDNQETESDALTTENEDAWEGELFLEDDEQIELFNFESLPLYQQAFSLTSDVLEWAHSLAGERKNLSLVHYCSHLTQIPANIARGHGFGLEHEYIGGYIACVKRGLADANAALATLKQMKTAPYMESGTYRRFYEQTYELRNALGVYVQDLRAKFDLDID